MIRILSWLYTFEDFLGPLRGTRVWKHGAGTPAGLQGGTYLG